jgi:hypothetical protein
VAARQAAFARERPDGFLCGQRVIAKPGQVVAVQFQAEPGELG